ncbi:PLP-dependent transferase [Mycena rebaudengoi]|nr:PLP-dependent transferase [Mycena rebaudengoi]
MSTAKEGKTQASFLPDSYYTRFLSDTARERQPSPIRSLYPLEATPGLISLLAGKPNPDTFPFTSFSFTARVPGADGAAESATEMAVEFTPAELGEALQYGATAGVPGLVAWLEGLQASVHGRARGDGWAVSVGTGSQDLLSKAIVELLNPGDAVLVQSPVYPGRRGRRWPLPRVPACDPRGLARGEALSRRSLYTIPYGGNPTGATTTLERRREVLQLAREHEFLILEGKFSLTALGLINMNTCRGLKTTHTTTSTTAPPPRAPSYFALELERVAYPSPRALSATPDDDGLYTHPAGLVLRLDSLSKILSAGLRIGFATGPAPLLNALNAHTAISNLQTSSLSQMVTLRLLEGWAYEGFHRHVDGVAAFYRGRRDVFEGAMRRYLGAESEGGRVLAEWVMPEAGMFYWFKLILPESDSAAFIRTTAFAHGVLALPGTVFLPDGRRSAYVRAAFSLLGEAEVGEAVRRVREAVLGVWAAHAEGGGA